MEKVFAVILCKVLYGPQTNEFLLRLIEVFLFWEHSENISLPNIVDNMVIFYDYQVKHRRVKLDIILFEREYLKFLYTVKKPLSFDILPQIWLTPWLFKSVLSILI